MKRTPHFLAGAVVIGLAAAAARSSLAQDAEREMVTLNEQSSIDQPVSLKAGQSFAIELESNIGTGFNWSVKEPLPAGVTLVSSGRVGGSAPDAGSEPRLGEPDRQRFVFKPDTQGRVDVILVYRRPWENTGEPAKTFRISVDVK